MTQRSEFDTIELYQIRILHTLITERSVTRAALRLQSTQPAISAQLKKLRELTGDPLLVRSGHGMTPTATALRLVGPAGDLLQEVERLFSPRLRSRGFEPATATGTLRIAASDFLDPLFLPELVAAVKAQAPGLHLDLLPLSEGFDYRRALSTGEVDLVIGNWLEPPGELHLGRLFSDEVVCLVSDQHPVASSARVNARGWTLERYLACEHVAPAPNYLGARGVIDDYLVSLGHQRSVGVRSAHVSLIPQMVARSLLVLTTGRLFCSRYVDTLPVRIVPCPVALPPLTYYQLWHDLTHEAARGRWLRELVRDVARGLGSPKVAARGRKISS